MNKCAITITSEKANLFAMINLIFCIPLICLHFIIWKDSTIPNSLLTHIGIQLSVLIFIVSLILAIILHELLHALAFILLGNGNLKSIEFGIKDFNPYCHYKEKLKVKYYKIATLLPFIVLGVICFIIGLLINELILTLFAVTQMLCASGDLIIVYLLRTVKSDALAEDHPYEIGLLYMNRV